MSKGDGPLHSFLDFVFILSKEHALNVLIAKELTK
jgi:hypothetical protein